MSVLNETIATLGVLAIVSILLTLANGKPLFSSEGSRPDGRLDRLDKSLSRLESLIERLREQVEDIEDVREAERRLDDTSQAPIPFEEVRKMAGLDEDAE